MTTTWLPASGPTPFALAVHGGAGARPEPLRDPELHHRTLREALTRGQQILARGGSASDAVCAAVTVLEDSPLFNAARGAALATDGVAELDAALMEGAGVCGGVIGSHHARNPILAARAVLAQTPHVLMVDPSVEVLAGWGVQTAPAEYFLTERRLREVEEARAAHLAPTGHGTVGAVARDLHGAVAAATSTGGVTNQLPGRVGDTPLIGAGTFADNETVAVSCTGTGEHFIRAVAAHDVHARMKYLDASLREAVEAVLDGIGAAGGEGGLIAVDRQGNALVSFNSNEMFCGYLDDGEPVTHV
jgi:beta-aspartyl-peptidase (threonine type)